MLSLALFLNLSRSSHFSLLIICYALLVLAYKEIINWDQFVDILAFVLFVTYVFAGLNKLNLGFLSGSVILNHSILNKYTGYNFGSTISYLVTSISLLVIIFEFVLAFVVITKRLQKSWLVLGVAFHISIVLFMHETSITIFVELLLFNYLCIVMLSSIFQRSHWVTFTVIWDANCSFCKGTISLLRLCGYWNIVPKICIVVSQHFVS